MPHEQQLINIDLDKLNSTIDNLSLAFEWSDTIDGDLYWQRVLNRLIGLKQHGTSDYKPLQPKQPEITDEWLIRFIKNHGRRPMVQVRDLETLNWCGPTKLYSVEDFSRYRYIVPGRACEFCKLADGEPLE